MNNINLDNEKLPDDTSKLLNEESWNNETYQAWVNRFGNPNEVVQKMIKDPEKCFLIYLVNLLM